MAKMTETVWSKTLGCGQVQPEVINEIAVLPKNSAYHQQILEVFADFQVNLENNTDRQPDEDIALQANDISDFLHVKLQSTG